MSGNSPLELHSADLANFGRSQTISLVSRPKFAKSYESQTENPSVVDSALRVESNKKNKSKKHIKSFCYFWLSPKVESPYTSSLRGESMDSPKQSKKNNLHEVQTESHPIRGAKNRIQGCSSATADFLLESDKRGSPPKSEKAAAFWGHNLSIWGERRLEVQPFLRKEIDESKTQNSDSIANNATV